jgi:hypothetical protein
MTGAAIGCCETHSGLIREWLASGHPLANRWIALIRRACKRDCGTA